jgi:hypothetical protein
VSSPSYSDPVSQLLALDSPQFGHRNWPDYGPLGLTSSDVPELLRIIDEGMRAPDPDTPLGWAPVHAWRVLGHLRDLSAIQPLLGVLRAAWEDDWVTEEIPRVLAMIGPTAIPQLTAVLKETRHSAWARVAASDSLAEIGELHPERREEVVATLAGQLSKWWREPPVFNAFIVAALVQMKAVEAAATIEEAFAEDAVELDVNGDWEDVQVELGLLEQRLTPRPPLFRDRRRLSSRIPPARGPDPKANPKATAKARRKAESEARKRNRRRK